MTEPNQVPALSHGIAECRHRGWAVVHVPGEGFRPCRADEPGAYVDLSLFAFWHDGHVDRLDEGTAEPQAH
jgi:hypothetical protein